MTKTKAVPKGYNTVTTYLAVKKADSVLAFIKKAFGAKVVEKHLNPDGSLMHAEATIGDTRLMMGDPHGHNPMTAMLYMYVPDCDVAYKKAIKAGGKSIMKPTDQFYGDRAGAVKDKTGNVWWMATRKAKPKKK
jgi:PhnB protein